ncbi:hypothetical protein CAEBREN_08592 [Caenorhabditis brenneri]|uniref:Receptor L-domain domain-containing protein n=1 Tax=Caenorhabditis brenneri TaxID=135651 RepID=G0P4J2_CAEBE|nr:hypothetical protein CAEBREN_08592 [Caenorhabditis brenneri]
MRKFFLFLLFYPFFQCRDQGPPPTDSPWFNNYEYYYDIYINETTISLPDIDPKYQIYQAVYITGNLKISPRELNIFFQSLWTCKYGIRVNNTNLKDLSFLKPYSVGVLDNTKNSIEITNNPNLTTIGIDFDECRFCDQNIVITNNPKLDLKAECDGIIGRYSSYRTISGNLVDCGCPIKGNFNKFLTTMAPNCWMLFGNVTIDQDSDLAVLKEKMVNVTRINGGLSVANTNFTDLSFLSALEWIEIDAKKSQYLATVSITNNTNLVSLNMTAKRDGLYLTIRDNPKLCVTPQDLDYLFYALSLDSDLNINICYDSETPSYWCQLPESGNFKDLPDGCKNITGNLVFDENFDFANSYRLYDMETLFGSFTIKNTSLRSMNMIPHFYRIKSFKDNIIPLHVYNNSKLPKLFRVFQLQSIESGMPATIENNESLDVWQIECSYMRTRKSVEVKNNRVNCEQDETVPRRKYDRTPLNIDVYKGVPVYIDVVPVDSADDSGAKNNPWDRNSTDPEYYDEEEIVTTTQNDAYRTSVLTFVNAWILCLFLLGII